MDLSIVIPARNELFLARTIQDILEHIEADTEVIIVLDGCWADPPIAPHPRVTVLHYDEAIGQRAAMNEAAKVARGKYLMKTDAHCAFDQGFDRKMLEVIEPDMTLVPVMRNLHVFNWRCKHCGLEVYQGAMPEQCRNETCTFEKQDFEMVMLWIPKTNPQSSAYRFNKDLRFKYFPELRQRQPKTGLAETMSLQGSCFMCTREKYWELGLCDQTWGSWGQQGTEVAIKTWLSGGRVLCNMDTWYAHLFRTQPGFSHPFPDPTRDQQRAIKISQDLFFNNKWDKAVRPLSWLLEKFWDVLKLVEDQGARWEDEDLQAQKRREQQSRTPAAPPQNARMGILYYTCNTHRADIEKACRDQLLAARNGHEVGCVSLKPTQFGNWNITLPLERSPLTMHKQIVAGLEHMKADYVFLCESDVLYHPSHFKFIPPSKDTFYYNTNVWKVRYPDGHAVWTDNLQQVSGICASRELLLDFFRRRVKRIERDGWNGHYEPNERYGCKTANWQSEHPNLDIRHPKTLTKSKWSPDEFRNQQYAAGWKETDEVPGWGRVSLFTGD